MDNATVNDVLYDTVARCVLALYLQPLNPDGHGRCTGHVTNLSVQDILAALNEAEWSDTVDYFELHKGSPLHYNADEDEDQKELETEEDVEEDSDRTVEDVAMKGISALEDAAAEVMVNTSPLCRVRLFVLRLQNTLMQFSTHLAALHCHKNCFFSAAPSKLQKDPSL